MSNSPLEINNFTFTYPPSSIRYNDKYISAILQNNDVVWNTELKEIKAPNFTSVNGSVYIEPGKYSILLVAGGSDTYEYYDMIEWGYSSLGDYIFNPFDVEDVYISVVGGDVGSYIYGTFDVVAPTSIPYSIGCINEGSSFGPLSASPGLSGYSSFKDTSCPPQSSLVSGLDFLSYIHSYGKNPVKINDSGNYFDMNTGGYHFYKDEAYDYFDKYGTINSCLVSKKFEVSGGCNSLYDVTDVFISLLTGYFHELSIPTYVKYPETTAYVTADTSACPNITWINPSTITRNGYGYGAGYPDCSFIYKGLTIGDSFDPDWLHDYGEVHKSEDGETEYMFSEVLTSAENISSWRDRKTITTRRGWIRYARNADVYNKYKYSRVASAGYLLLKKIS